MFSSINSFGLTGISCYPVMVEVDISRGMPMFEMVGLPDTAVKEARDRVRSAMRNTGIPLPEKRIIVNFAPAHTKKTGAIYDLPILIGILASLGKINASTEGMGFVGELSLDGKIRPVNGVLSMVLEAKERGLHTVFVPAENSAEGSACDGIDVYAAENLADILKHLRGDGLLPLAKSLPVFTPPLPPVPDLADVKGQQGAKRALEIAAAGGHNLLLLGSPGSGKSMLAKRLPGILPDLSREEAIETTKIHSIAGMLPPGVSLLTQRPFRSPHHTVSAAGLAGGGTIPRPGEISLAHGGVLFLDELPEFSHSTMEVLRQPIEDGTVTISRATSRITYPSSIMVVAAMNPCPCGFFGHPTKPCTCSSNTVSRYLGRISGPLLDRLDIQVEVAPVSFQSLSSTERAAENSSVVKARVVAARAIQSERLARHGIYCNAKISPSLLAESCQLTEDASKLLSIAFDKMSLSGRAYDRILKMARTIADLDFSEKIANSHISEAIQYRTMDRKYWKRG